MHHHEFTTDTRKPNCPIRIVYAGPHAGPYHSSEVCQAIYLPRDRPLAIIKATEHSDYSGGPVERSNQRALLEDETIAPHLVQIHGPHGYQALAYDATLGPIPGCDDLRAVLVGLEGYAVIDERDLGALEIELEGEAWIDYGRKDFSKVLTDLLDCEDEEHEHDLDDDAPRMARAAASLGLSSGNDVIDAVWRAGCDAYGVNGGSGANIETGCVVHFYIGEWIAAAKRDGDKISLHAAKYGLVQVPTITELAELTRV